VRSVRDNAMLVCNCAIVGLALGVAATALGAVQYTATALMAMSTNPDQTRAAADILQSDPVLRVVAQPTGRTGKAAGPAVEAQLAVAAADLRRRLKIEVEPGTDLVRVAITDPDRARSISTLQRLVEAGRVQRRALADLYGAPLAEQIRASPDVERFAAALRDMDGQIHTLQLRAGDGDIAHEAQSAAVLDESLAIKAAQLQARLRALDRELNTARDRLDASASQVFKLTAGGGLVEQTPEGGDVRALTGRVSSLGTERATVADQLREVQDQAAESHIHVGDLRQTQTQLDELQRARDALAAAYSQAQDQAGARLKNARLADASAGIRVLQPPSATAGRSSNPLFVVAGLGAGLACACVIILIQAIGRWVGAGRARAEASPQAPILAELGALDGASDNPASLQTISRLAAALVASNHVSHPLRFLQVSGPGEGEDKVALALLLGAEFAEAWRLPTLVIDLGGEAQQELLYGALDEQAITIGGIDLSLVKTQYPNIWAVTHPGVSASPYRNPRLSLNQIEEAIEAMRDRFQRVIMIAPRDFAGKGARRLNALADAHLLVVRSEKSRAPMLRRLRSVIAASGGDILGMVHTHSAPSVRETVDEWFKDVPPTGPVAPDPPLALSHYPQAPPMAAE
jgi:hypothetical protein